MTTISNSFTFVCVLLTALIIGGCGAGTRGTGTGNPTLGKINFQTAELNQPGTIVIVDVTRTDGSLLESLSTEASDLGEFSVELPIVDEEGVTFTVRISNAAIDVVTEPQPLPTGRFELSLVLSAFEESVELAAVDFTFPGATSAPASQATLAPTPVGLLPDPSPTPPASATPALPIATELPRAPVATATTVPASNSNPAPVNTPVTAPLPTVLPTATATIVPTPDVPNESIPVESPQTPVESTLARNCKEILGRGQTATGVYTVDPDGSGPGDSMSAFCDMTTDGGGWTLIMNYLHKAGTNPDRQSRESSLPLQNSVRLGDDESGSIYWGHAIPSLVGQFSFSEVRFYCKSSGDNLYAGPVHFKTSFGPTIDYVRTGSGSFAGLENNFTPLAGDGGALPKPEGADISSNNGDRMLIYRPFFQSNNGRRWSLETRRARQAEWNCNDRTFDGNPVPDTLHQVYVR